MPPTFHFVRTVLPGPALYQVRLEAPSGEFIGTVASLGGGSWQATIVMAGKLHTQPFPDREQAAAWLLSIAPKLGD